MLVHSTKFKHRYLQKKADHNASCPRTCPKNRRAAVPASPRSMDELVESAFQTRMQLFSLVPTLQSGSKMYESTSFVLRWSFYLVTTNVGILGRQVVRRRQRGIAISFCAVLLKLRCVFLIVRIETIRRQTSQNYMETDSPVCVNTKYGYLNSDRYLQWRMINSSIYCVIIGTRLIV